MHVCQPSTGQNHLNFLNKMTKYIKWDNSQVSVVSDIYLYASCDFDHPWYQ
jgi:hypothetical protein